MITVKPTNPAKAGDIRELEVGWDQDADGNGYPEWWITISGSQHRNHVGIDQFYLPEDPDMLAAVVRSILDPDRFSSYKAHTRIALMRAILPWAWRAGQIPQPQDTQEDMA